MPGSPTSSTTADRPHPPDRRETRCPVALEVDAEAGLGEIEGIDVGDRRLGILDDDDEAGAGPGVHPSGAALGLSTRPSAALVRPDTRPDLARALHPGSVEVTRARPRKHHDPHHPRLRFAWIAGRGRAFTATSLFLAPVGASATTTSDDSTSGRPLPRPVSGRGVGQPTEELHGRTSKPCATSRRAERRRRRGGHP